MYNRHVPPILGFTIGRLGYLIASILIILVSGSGIRFDTVF